MKPKRKKKDIITILIIVILKAAEAIDQENETEETKWTERANLLKAIAPQMEVDEEEWSTEQDAVWDAAEPLTVALGPGEIANYTNQQIETMFGTLASAVAEL